MKINIDKFKQGIIYVLLFLAAMNFFAKFFYFAFASLIILFIIQRKLLINHASLLYIALGTLMAVYNADEGFMSMLKCFAYAGLYLVGYNLMIVKAARKCEFYDYTHKENEKCGFILLAMVSCGSLTHYAMNFFYNIKDAVGRNTNDIWTGKTMAATGQSALACLMLGFAIAMIFLPPKKICRILGIIALVVIFGYNFILAGRTVIVMLALLIVVCLVYMHYVLKTPLAQFKLFIGVAIAVLSVAFIITFNIGGVQKFILESNLLGRFDISPQSYLTDSYRAVSKVSFLRNMWKYPFGGLHMSHEYGYAHDLFLDGYDEYGGLCLILLILIVAAGIRELYRLIRYTTYSYSFKLALLCIYIAVMLEFFVEPIFAGMPWLFACYSLINGFTKSMNLSYQHRLRGCAV